MPSQRRRNLGVGRGVVREMRNPRQVLEDPADEEPPGQPVVRVRLDLRLAENGVTTRQLTSDCGESTTKHLSSTLCPVSTLPPYSSPLSSRALMLTVKKSDVRDCPSP